MEYLKVCLTAFISAAVLFIITKLLGYRQMSELSLFDYINGITIGSIASEVAVSGGMDCIKPLIAMAIYGAIALILSELTDVSLPLRRFFVGKPIVLFDNGTFYYKNMKKAKIDINELTMQARSNGYFDMSEIRYALLEPNGRISFLANSKDRPVTPSDMKIVVDKEYAPVNVVLDGKVMVRNLVNVGLNEAWLEAELKKQHVELGDIMLACCHSNTLKIYQKDMNRKSDTIL